MLSAIKEVGNWQRKKYKKDEMDILIQEPFKSGGRVVFIKVDLDLKAFEGIDLEDYDSSKKMKYLFRKGPPNGPNPTPTANISEINKTFENKIQKWFQKHSSEDKLFEEIKQILSISKAKITETIQNCLKDIDKKEGKLLTIKIKQDNEWKYIGDFEIFKNKLIETEIQKDTKISQKNKVCSVCGKQKGSVTGDISVFKFYTIDKPGFITGGFNKNFAWKNFPVCSECKLDLEEGKKFLENNLFYKFYGLNYLLIPKLLLGELEIKSDIVNILLDSNKIVSLKNEVKKRITSDDNEILEILSDEKDVLTLNFLFLKKEQSAERILLLIEDIFPSRIRKIFQAKEFVERIFNEEFNFGRIRNFFSKSSEGKRENDLDKYFLEIVDSVFKGRKLDYIFLLEFFMAAIRREFINDEYFMQRVKDSLMNTIFFENLGLISFKEENMEENIFECIFTNFGKSFATPVKRGIFLLGALTQLLLNKQWTDRNAKPFMKYLKGLRMNEKDIKALLPKVQNKLEEYDSFDRGKRIIASEASKYLLQSGDNWKMPIDEINYYFACGMNLADKIANIVYQDKN